MRNSSPSSNGTETKQIRYWFLIFLVCFVHLIACIYVLFIQIFTWVLGFKKEYLKVQIDNHGNVKISGARPLQPLDASKWSRFRKDFKVPTKCDASSIRAKFENGSLSVFMPKLENKNIDEEDKEEVDLTKVNEKDKKKSDESKDEMKEPKENADGKMSGKMELKKNRVSRMLGGKGKTVVGMVLLLGLSFYFTQWILTNHYPFGEQQQMETYYEN